MLSVSFKNITNLMGVGGLLWNRQPLQLTFPFPILVFNPAANWITSCSVPLGYLPTLPLSLIIQLALSLFLSSLSQRDLLESASVKLWHYSSRGKNTFAQGSKPGRQKTGCMIFFILLLFFFFSVV